MNGFYLENMKSCKDELTNEELFIEKAQYPDRIREYNNRIFNNNIGLVRTIVHKTVQNLNEFCLQYSITKDEVYSLGFYGLYKAISRFDISKGYKFATYASRVIENEIRLFIRNNKKRMKDISLEVEIHDDYEGGSILTLSDMLDDPDKDIESNYVRKEEVEMLYRLKDYLPATDCEIVRLSFFHGLTQREIGARLGLSQSIVSRKLKQIYKKLKKEFMKQGIYYR